MCQRCEHIVVSNMDIKESDLIYLPYKIVRWQCFIDGCKGGIKVKDYGISPFYIDPAKKKSSVKKGWRGGWFDASCHFYICSKHMTMFREICDSIDNTIDNAAKFLSKVIVC